MDSDAKVAAPDQDGPTIQQIDTEFRLTAMLLDYQLRNDEIQNRSDVQNRLVQIHITSIGLISTAVFSNTLELSSTFLLFIAIESALFGRWWLDHAITISKVGDYMARITERRIARLIGPGALSWETDGRDPNRESRGSTAGLLMSNMYSLVMFTFGLPQIASALAVLYFRYEQTILHGNLPNWKNSDLFLIVLLLAAVLLSIDFRRLWKEYTKAPNHGHGVDNRNA